MGAGVAVAASAWGWPTAVLVLGVLLVAAALALIAAAIVSSGRQAVRVELSDAGYRVAQPSETNEGAWADVTKVTQAPGRLTFHQGDSSRFHIIAPHASAQLEAMASDIAGRLDRDRGYRPFA